jgi:hypothetical protein
MKVGTFTWFVKQQIKSWLSILKYKTHFNLKLICHMLWNIKEQEGHDMFKKNQGIKKMISISYIRNTFLRHLILYTMHNRCFVEEEKEWKKYIFSNFMLNDKWCLLEMFKTSIYLGASWKERTNVTKSCWSLAKSKWYVYAKERERENECMNWQRMGVCHIKWCYTKHKNWLRRRTTTPLENQSIHWCRRSFFFPNVFQELRLFIHSGWVTQKHRHY